MNSPKYSVGEVLKVDGLPEVFGSPSLLNGGIVRVVSSPILISDTLEWLYGVKFINTGKELPAVERYLHPFHPKRKDMDMKATWGEFEAATGISADIVRGTDSEHG